MNRTAVIFPGVGYTKDRPLLYYSGKLAKEYGYELKHIEFTGLSWSKEQLKDPVFLRNTLEKCLDMTEKALADAGDLSGDDTVFISKSIGTVVATAYAGKTGSKARQICFSPLHMIEGFVKEGNGVLFYGDADPFADFRDIERIAEEKKLEGHRIAGGNHSLETGDILADIENLSAMMHRVSEVLKG